MPSVPVALNQITRTGARTRANQSAFFAADNRADDRAAGPADERALRPAVVMPAVTPLRKTRASESSEEQHQTNHRRDDASIKD
jgi:hypothetical protein